MQKTKLLYWLLNVALVFTFLPRGEDAVAVAATENQQAPLWPELRLAAPNQISITEAGFSPATLSVFGPTDITWINTTTTTHTLLSGEPQIDPGGSTKVYLPVIQRGSSSAVEAASTYLSYLYQQATAATFDVTLAPGQSYTYRFTAPDTYKFYLATAPTVKGNLTLDGVALLRTSPSSGESEVAVTRETVFEFSGALDPNSVTPAAFVVQAGNTTLGYRLALSADKKRVTLFYKDALPGSIRVRVSVDGNKLKDAKSTPVDVDGDGAAGGNGLLEFDTLSLTVIPGTIVCGRVFASELAVTASNVSVNTPLQGVLVSVDGLAESLRTTTDANGNFCLNPAPAGRFFVHVDGHSATNNIPAGQYYPMVGKAWQSTPGQKTSVGDIYLPLIPANTLQPVSAAQDTQITFADSVLQIHPELNGVSILVPADSLFNDDGERGGKVGIAPVPPDRLPGGLPEGLDFPVVITVQTDGAMNFDKPAPVCFPNLPDPNTDKKLKAGAKGSLFSFNHDTGAWDAVGLMTVTEDERLVCTDPGVGIRAPGWHGVGNFIEALGGDIARALNNAPNELPPGFWNAAKGLGKLALRSSSRFGGKLSPLLGGVIDAAAGATAAVTGTSKAIEDITAGRDPSNSIKEVNNGVNNIVKGMSNGLLSPWNHIANEAGKVGNDINHLMNKHFGIDLSPRRDITNKAVENTIVDLMRKNYDDIKKAEELHNAFFEWSKIYFGNDAVEWMDGITSAKDYAYFATIHSALTEAMTPDSNAGAEISPNEREMILNMAKPLSLSTEQLTTIVNRFERTTKFYIQGILTHESAPAGQQDFVDINQLRASVAILEQTLLREQADGFGHNLDRMGIAVYELMGHITEFVRTQGNKGGDRVYVLILDINNTIVFRAVTDSQQRMSNVFLASNSFYDVLIFNPKDFTVAKTSFITESPGTVNRLPATFFGTSDTSDADNDGLHEDGEMAVGTDINNPDTDSDGILDGTEVKNGTDPLGGFIAQTGIIGSADTPGTAVDICVQNDLAVVADSDAGVVIFNIFDSMNPKLVAQVDTPGNAQRVACANGRVAVADGDSGLAILDISNIAKARVTQQIKLNSKVTAVASTGTIAYAATILGHIAAVNMVNGDILDEVTIPEFVQDLFIQDETLYAFTTKKLYAFALYDSTLNLTGSAESPSFIGAGGRLGRLFVGGNLAYTTHTQGYNTFDLTIVGQPVLLQSGETQQFGWKQIVPNDAGIGVAAVGPNSTDDGPHNISLYNVSDPKQTDQFITQFETPGLAAAVTLYNGRAYVADSEAGMQVINYLAYDSKHISPTISLSTNFAPGKAEPSTLMRITANTTDDTQVRHVEFYVDSKLVATDGNFPFEYRFTTPSMADAPSFTMRARAIDTGGNETWTDMQTVTLVQDATPPPDFTVTNLNDSGSGSLRQSIADAKNGQRIGFAINGTIVLASEIVVNKNITIQGPGKDKLIISGNNATRVFQIAQNNNVVISGLRIMNGKSDQGGGIYNGGNLSLSNVVIANNTSVNEGGGIYVFGDIDHQNKLLLRNSTVMSNTAENGGGGGIFNCCGGFDLGYTTLTVLNSLIQGNNAKLSGGGIFVGNTTTSQIISSTIAYNKTTSPDGWGGGIFIGQLGSHKISASLITGNVSSEYGGGITAYTDIMLAASTVSNNKAAKDGGGIAFPSSFGGLRLIGSTISNNEATDGRGGGIYTPLELYIINSTIANNRALKQQDSSGGVGGGIVTDHDYTILFTTVTGNHADVACGGIGRYLFNSPVHTLKANIIAGNSAPSNLDYCPGSETTLISLGYNIVGDGTETGFVHGMNNDQVGVDPLLKPLGNYGGDTPTVGIQLGSPAINKIPTNACTDKDDKLLTSDQRGVVRPQEAACDVGAYEYP